jgi:integrase
LKTEWKEVGMQSLTYTSRGLGRRRNGDRWEAVRSHTDPVTGEVVRMFHTVEGKARRQAKRARDALILELVRARTA